MSKKLSFLTALAVMGLLSCNTACVADEVKMAPKGMSRKDIVEFNNALKLLNDKEFQAAYDKFKKLSDANPNLVEARTMQSAALLKMDKPEEALAVLHEAETIDPDDALIIFNLGTAYMLTGKRDRALEKFQKYLRLYPTKQYAAESQARIDMLLTEIARNDGVTNSKGQDNYLEEAMALGAGRWTPAQIPVPVYIAPGQGVTGYRDEFADILKQSFLDWTEASQGRITFNFVSSPNNALIQCSWTNDPATLANPAEGGEALPMVNFDGSMIGARVKLLTKKPTLPVIPNHVLRSIALHEVGHAIGLLGHSSQPGDVMLAALSDNANLTISDRDKKTIYLLYTAPDSVIKSHPLKLSNASYKGENTSPENRAIRLINEAIQETNKSNYTKAIQLLDQAQKLAPNMEVIFINLARVYNDLGNEAQRLSDYAGVRRYYDLAIENFVKAKRADLAVQYCDILMSIANQESNSVELLKYKNLKNKLTGATVQ